MRLPLLIGGIVLLVLVIGGIAMSFVPNFEFSVLGEDSAYSPENEILACRGYSPAACFEAWSAATNLTREYLEATGRTIECSEGRCYRVNT